MKSAGKSGPADRHFNGHLPVTLTRVRLIDPLMRCALQRGWDRSAIGSRKPMTMKQAFSLRPLFLPYPGLRPGLVWMRPLASSGKWQVAGRHPFVGSFVGMGDRGTEGPIFIDTFPL